MIEYLKLLHMYAYYISDLDISIYKEFVQMIRGFTIRKRRICQVNFKFHVCLINQKIKTETNKRLRTKPYSPRTFYMYARIKFQNSTYQRGFNVYFDKKGYKFVQT